MSHRLELPPGCCSDDFVGVSHDALVAMLQSGHAGPARFLKAIVAYVERHGATNNQRQLLVDAWQEAIASLEAEVPG